MALLYFKLGPSADQFYDSSLGAFLVQGNAMALDNTYYDDYRFYPFIRSGFIIQIALSQFNLIQVKSSNPKNIPAINTQVASINILEPVDFISNTVPEVGLTGQRILIGTTPEGIFTPFPNQIATYDGANWSYYIPSNKNTINVRNNGSSTHYIGTYPSGYWDYITSQLTNTSNSNPSPSSSDIDSLTLALQQEIQARITQYNQLLQAINNLGPTSITASNVSVADLLGNFQVTPKNVENVLALLNQTIKNLATAVQNGINTVNGLNIANLQAELEAEILFKGQWSGGTISNTGSYWIFGGKLWLSTSDDNAGTPGIDNTYGEVLTAYLSATGNNIPTQIQIPIGTPNPVTITYAGGGSTPFDINILTGYGNDPTIIMREILTMGVDGDGNPVITTYKIRNDIQPQINIDPLTGDIINIVLNLDTDGDGNTIDNLELTIKI